MYEKMKAEEYAHVGGINSKASAYITSDKEVLGLENYDFQTPGAWSKRWGFTAAYTNSLSLSLGASTYISNIFNTSISDPSVYGNFAFVGSSDGIYKLGFSGSFQNLSKFASLAGSSTFKAIVQNVSYKDQTFVSWGLNYSPNIKIFTGSGAGATLTPYRFGSALPPQTTLPTGAGLTVTATSAGAALSGTYIYQYAYIDTSGFIGPLSGTFVYSTAGVGSITINGFTTIGEGGANAASFAYVAYALFRNKVTGFPSSQMVKIDEFTTPPYIDANTQTTLEVVDVPVASSFLNTITYEPQMRLIEMYKDRLWFTGDGRNGANYSLWFSEIGDPQNFQPENFIIIENEGDPITSIRRYNQSLIIHTLSSVYRLTGDDPNNFNVQMMTNEYGTQSEKSVIVWEERMWFLDGRRIVEFNGSNFKTVSNRMEAYLDRINFQASFRMATAIHIQERNEVWFSIPVDGSDYNNLTLVYDYLVDGWTTFKGDKFKATTVNQIFTDTSLDVSKSTFSVNQKYYMGSIGGSMFYFDDTFKSDDGTGITLKFTTRYHNELGKSRTAQFRRFYLDVGGYTGATLNFGLRFMANYSTLATAYTTSMNFNQFQDRIDFGIPAKSLSIEVSHGSTQGELQIGGYTMEFRYQRDV